MGLPLKEHIWNTISLLYKQIKRAKFQYLEFFLAKKSILAIFAYTLLKINIFRLAMF